MHGEFEENFIEIERCCGQNGACDREDQDLPLALDGLGARHLRRHALGPEEASSTIHAKVPMVLGETSHIHSKQNYDSNLTYKPIYTHIQLDQIV